MTAIESLHADHGATFVERDGRRVVDHYGRPERTHRAVRNGVGVIEHDVGVAVVEGDDRVDFVDNAVTNHVPSAEGSGCYALLLDPKGRVETDLTVYAAGERLLVFAPPARVGPLVEDWSAKTFIQDVDVRDATDGFAVFGVHGTAATEKMASVLHGAGAPEPAHAFVRGELGDVGVTVAADDGLAGEPGYLVVCDADDAGRVFDVLVTMGAAAAPFGRRTWRTLTLEAGTSLFPDEIAGRIPNELGLRSALDFAKGCYVGQEVVARIENLGHPGSRLVGLRLDGSAADGGRREAGDAAEVDDGAEIDAADDPADDGGSRPDAADADPWAAVAGAAVTADGEAVGEVTRAAASPTLEAPVALAVVDWSATDGGLAVDTDDGPVPAERATLPFVEGSVRSGRLPTYE